MFIRIDNEGKRYFFPYGRIGKGYFIDSDEKFTEAESMMTGMRILFAGIFVLGIDPVNMKIHYIFPLAFIPILVIAPFFVIFKLNKANVEWVKTLSYTKPSTPMTRKQVILRILFGVFLLITLVTWLLYRKENYKPTDSFFLGYFLYTIYKFSMRLWSGDYTEKVD
jgi:hypothetical protein